MNISQVHQAVNTTNRTEIQFREAGRAATLAKDFTTAGRYYEVADRARSLRIALQATIAHLQQHQETP